VRNAIYVEVPTKVLVERLAGRWMCRTCQTTYHEEFDPPSSEGVCDVCSGELYQRPDDRRDVVANRVNVYLRDTLPVVKRFEQRGLLRRIDGNRPIQVVCAALHQALGVSEGVRA
jgi:adenylate kinase